MYPNLLVELGLDGFIMNGMFDFGIFKFFGGIACWISNGVKG